MPWQRLLPRTVTERTHLTPFAVAVAQQLPCWEHPMPADCPCHVMLISHHLQPPWKSPQRPSLTPTSARHMAIRSHARHLPSISLQPWGCIPRIHKCSHGFTPPCRWRQPKSQSPVRQWTPSKRKLAQAKLPNSSQNAALGVEERHWQTL